MKTRYLQKLLDTARVTGDYGDYIAVGSPMCHNLINIDKKTLKMEYALDTFHEGRKSIRSYDLELIWDKLTELIASGEIKNIIEGNDEIKTALLPVFTFKEGKIIETATDKYGYPNTTVDGEVMYESRHFPTKEAAIEKAIIGYSAGAELAARHLKQVESDLLKAKEELATYEGYVEQLKSLQNQSAGK